MSNAALLSAAALLAAFVSSAASANEPSGAAAPAVVQWFRSDLGLGCVNPDGGDVACGVRNQPVFQVAYGNAGGGGGTQDAVAVVVYVNDPTGNAQQLAAAAFQQDGNGVYRLSRRLPGLLGAGVAPGPAISFGHGKAVVTLLVRKPGDSACCPTGRRQVSLDLR